MLVFGLIIIGETVFGSALSVAFGLWGGVFSGLYVAATIVAFYTLTRNFRNRRTSDYKRGFSAMGAVIFLFVPLLWFIIPGILYLIAGWELALYIGLGLVFVQMVAIAYGIGRGRWRWKVHKHELHFENLPAEADGTSVVQISDMHIGSFFRLFDKVKPAFDTISSLNADYIVFTGDLVNNIAEEVNGWEEMILGLRAKKGKFSILGNHDYGDYVPWENEDQKQSNLQALVNKHREIGFTPLLNESVALGDNFYLLGVENWGVKPFRQSGKLQETLASVPEPAFKLLLSHDPSHFDEQVVGTGIDLTLSGHTHGMQFGIERFGIKWSPVSLRYKKWAGLYAVGKQLLYVNRGFGYLGFPGRVGIYPEITHFILRSGKS